MKRNAWKWKTVGEIFGVSAVFAVIAAVMYGVLLFAAGAVSWITGWSWPLHAIVAPWRWFSATSNVFGPIMLWDENWHSSTLFGARSGWNCG